MFDRTVLCSEGFSLYESIRAKSLVLSNDESVKVFFVNQAFTPPITDLQGITNSSLYNGNELANGIVRMRSSYVNKSELHIVAQGDTDSGTGEDTDYNTGHHVIVTVNDLCLLCAYSDELLRLKPSLQMTFGIEETNGVMKASADFDGVITQGILEKYLQEYTIGSEGSSQGSGGGVSGITLSAIESIIDRRLSEYTKTSQLADVALSNRYTDLDDKPSFNVGNGTVTIKKRNKDENASRFNLNDSDGTYVNLNLGTAADANVCTKVDDSSLQDTFLVTKGQAIDIARNYSEPKTVEPTIDTDIEVPIGASLWLAICFEGDIGIAEFTTSQYVPSQQEEIKPAPQVIPVWSGTQTTSTCAFVARFLSSPMALEPTTQALAKNQRFRTLHACTSAYGYSNSCFGYAMCVRVKDPEIFVEMVQPALGFMSVNTMMTGLSIGYMSMPVQHTFVEVVQPSFDTMLIEQA